MDERDRTKHPDEHFNMTQTYPQLEALRHQIIVSVQAYPDTPLNAPHFIAALAQSAEMGGAAGVSGSTVRKCSRRPGSQPASRDRNKQGTYAWV